MNNVEPFSAGRDVEREAVVKWLRKQRTPSGYPYANLMTFATKIERGEHLNQPIEPKRKSRGFFIIHCIALVLLFGFYGEARFNNGFDKGSLTTSCVFAALVDGTGKPLDPSCAAVDIDSAQMQLRRLYLRATGQQPKLPKR